LKILTPGLIDLKDDDSFRPAASPAPCSADFSASPFKLAGSRQRTRARAPADESQAGRKEDRIWLQEDDERYVGRNSPETGGCKSARNRLKTAATILIFKNCLSPSSQAHPHPRPRIHRRGSKVFRHRWIASRPRIRPPIQKDASPEMTSKDERTTFPLAEKGVIGTRRMQP